jgi:acyl carrier protein
MSGAVRATVRGFIANNFLYGEAEESLADDTSFLATGMIDSTGILELVTFLEHTFGIRVEDDEVVPENLDSLGRITAYVARKLAGAYGGVGAKAAG